MRLGLTKLIGMRKKTRRHYPFTYLLEDFKACMLVIYRNKNYGYLLLKFELILIFRLGEQLYGSVGSDLIPKLKMKIRFLLIVSYTQMKSVKFLPV